MAGVKVTIPNLKKVRESLGKAKARLDDLGPVAKNVTLYLLSLVQRRFRSDDPGAKKWEPLSAFTIFIRRHRANSPTNSTRPLSDKGLLRNSNFPFIRDGGSEFGVVNSLKYASLMNFGGRSQGGDVIMKNFPRKLPGLRAAGARGLSSLGVGKRRTKRLTGSSNGMSKVIKKFYTLHIKPADVPARPFFPVEDEYMPGVRRIMALHARGALGG